MDAAVFERRQRRKLSPKINQETLLNIVSTWHVKQKSEFRIFKCGNCRRILRRAWHYWLHIGGFKTPVHLCKECQRDLKITYPKLNLKLSKIDLRPSQRLKPILLDIVSQWNIKVKPCFKQFQCDYCKRTIHKANHIPVKIKAKISEVHLCKQCWTKILERCATKLASS